LAAFDKAQFEATNPKIEYREKQKTILSRLAKSLENEDLADVKSLIEELKLQIRIQVLKTGQK
jgi:glycyl-tRNA synthetase